MSSSDDSESVFKAWLKDHYGIVVKVTRSFAQSVVDAEDLRQDILIQLWNSVSSYDGRAKPSTWIYRVCLNSALVWRRTRKRRLKRFELGTDVERIAIDQVCPGEAAAKRELIERLYVAIRQMSEFERTLVLLMLDGLPYKEIAEITGLTENHVGVALTRARRRLAELLKGVSNELE